MELTRPPVRTPVRRSLGSVQLGNRSPVLQEDTPPRAGSFRARNMSLPVVLRPAAEADIEATHSELEQIQAGLGDRFVSRVREVLERIEAMPHMYGVVWQDVRAVRLRKFRHVVYYLALKDHVEVLAVLHGARDFSAWQSRV